MADEDVPPRRGGVDRGEVCAVGVWTPGQGADSPPPVLDHGTLADIVTLVRGDDACESGGVGVEM